MKKSSYICTDDTKFKIFDFFAWSDCFFYCMRWENFVRFPDVALAGGGHVGLFSANVSTFSHIAMEARKKTKKKFHNKTGTTTQTQRPILIYICNQSTLHLYF